MAKERSRRHLRRSGVRPHVDPESQTGRAELMLALERLIARRQLTQAQAAKLLGVSQPRVKISCGVGCIASASMLASTCRRGRASECASPPRAERAWPNGRDTLAAPTPAREVRQSPSKVHIRVESSFYDQILR